MAEEAQSGFSREREFGYVGEDPGRVSDEEGLRAVAVAAEEAVLAQGVAG
jgi:hypothetical protein